MLASPRNGAIAELSFTAECLKNDIQLYKPTVDVGCDFITIHKNKPVKIQVKSSSSPSQNKKGYSFGITTRAKNKDKYSNIDYFALYILPLGLTYIIPSTNITKTKITIYPNRITCKFNRYLNAFYLLK
jgi:hypothetical protein